VVRRSLFFPCVKLFSELTCRHQFSVLSSLAFHILLYYHYWHSLRSVLACCVINSFLVLYRLTFIFCIQLSLLSLLCVSIIHNQWCTQDFFLCGGGSTNLVEDRGQIEWGSGGGSPLVRGSAKFANGWNPYSYWVVTDVFSTELGIWLSFVKTSEFQGGFEPS
jgi:hypothetical protein